MTPSADQAAATATEVTSANVLEKTIQFLHEGCRDFVNRRINTIHLSGLSLAFRETLPAGFEDAHHDGIWVTNTVMSKPVLVALPKLREDGTVTTVQEAVFHHDVRAALFNTVESISKDANLVHLITDLTVVLDNPHLPENAQVNVTVKTFVMVKKLWLLTYKTDGETILNTNAERYCSFGEALAALLLDSDATGVCYTFSPPLGDSLLEIPREMVAEMLINQQNATMEARVRDNGDRNKIPGSERITPAHEDGMLRVLSNSRDGTDMVVIYWLQREVGMRKKRLANASKVQQAKTAAINVLAPGSTSHF